MSRVCLSTFDSPLGWMTLVTRDACVLRLVFGYDTAAGARGAVGEFANQNRPTGRPNQLIRRLQQYAEGTDDDFRDVEVDLSHTAEFAQRVLEWCRKIPYGKTRSYQQLAKAAGSPSAARAVGSCMSSNRVPIIIPCHRVVYADGRIGPYTCPSGPAMKSRLLQMEGARNLVLT